MISKQGTTSLSLSLSSLVLLLHNLHLTSAQECSGTTYSGQCCQGVLYGASVAMAPSSTFPTSLPSDFTASNDFLPVPTNVLPSDPAVVTDSAGLSSLSTELESLVSEAQTDTAIFSILPISDAGPGNFQPLTGRQVATATATIDPPLDTSRDVSLAAGVTCNGEVVPLATGSTTTDTEDQSSSTSSGADSTTEGGAGNTNAVGESANPSDGAAAAMPTGLVGAMLGAGFGVVFNQM